MPNDPVRYGFGRRTAFFVRGFLAVATVLLAIVAGMSSVTRAAEPAPELRDVDLTAVTFVNAAEIEKTAEGGDPAAVHSGFARCARQPDAADRPAGHGRRAAAPGHDPRGRDHGPLPETDVVRFVFPTHCELEILKVRVNADAQLEAGFEPYDYRRLPGALGKRWLVHGDSITQGANVSVPTMTWVDLVARRLGMAAVNLGIGGYGKAEPAMAADIASRNDFDVLSLHIDDHGAIECADNLAPVLAGALTCR